MPTRAELKRDAKEAMRGRKPSIYLVTFVYCIIAYVISMLAERILLPGFDISYVTDPDTLAYYFLYNSPSVFAQLLSILLQIMSYIIGVGLTIVCLRASRRMQAGIGDLFDGFGLFFKLIWLSIVSGFFTFLWSLLLVVPGIIAAYRYSMAVYILLDNPEYSAMECIRQSKQLMDGHKLDLFVLQLSFIGWYILTAIPFVSIYVTPYTEVTTANFYNALIGRVPSEPADAEETRSWDSYREPWDQ